MNGFSNQTTGSTNDKKSSAFAVSRYNTARSNLLLAVLFTVVNMVLGCFGANIYLLFSISFPYFMFDLSDLVWSIPAVVVLGLYVVFYLCSKKKPGFMIAALITFIVDFLFLIGYSLILTGIPDAGVSAADFIIDYLTHIWVLVYLIIGTRFSKRYRAAIRENPSLVSGTAFQNAVVPTEENFGEAAVWTENPDPEPLPVSDGFAEEENPQNGTFFSNEKDENGIEKTTE